MINYPGLSEVALLKPLPSVSLDNFDIAYSVFCTCYLKKSTYYGVWLFMCVELFGYVFEGI